jgi:hypothetical protein
MRVYGLRLQKVKKRHSKGVSFYCHPEELIAIVEPILSKAGMQLCTTRKHADRELPIALSSPASAKSTYPRFYVCSPAMSEGSGLRTLAGIVQIWFPEIVEGSLRMGEIGMLVAESELDGQLQNLQETLYRTLRKALVGAFRRGVWGRNSKTGGEHFYRDILISQRAVGMYSDGIVLATQLGDGFVTFHVQAPR